jgi:hypothetical protein
MVATRRTFVRSFAMTGRRAHLTGYSTTRRDLIHDLLPF